jgi:galactokinase
VSADHRELSQKFEAHFHAAPAALVEAPGRVNLIGEHTDYSEGFVLPAAVPLTTVVLARKRQDNVLRTVAARIGETDAVDLSRLEASSAPRWTRYVRGVAAGLKRAGIELSGADLLVDGDLPMGSGLSSSASLEIGVALALAELAEARLDPLALARIAQRAEHEFAGVECGLMDQLAILFGKPGHLLLIDCRSLTVEPAALPAGVELLIFDTGTRRQLADSALNQRRAECARAVEALHALEPSVVSLRDANLELLTRHQTSLDRAALLRARHVVTENERVLATVSALRQACLEDAGAQMNASHASLCADYDVSGPELDQMVAAARATAGIYGARLTGAGFAGCVVALASSDRAEEAAAAVLAKYRERAGRAGSCHRCKPGAGARVIRD